MATKQALKSALEAVGLFGPALAIKRRLVGMGMGEWKPLVPAEAFTQTCATAIRTLQHAGHEFGDYLEFGVSRGTSLACMSNALDAAGLTQVRRFGFDSFEGMPPETKGQGWDPGEFVSTLPATQAYLKSQGVDMSRVTLTRGWFRDTCTPETAARLGLTKASLIMMDCDIYTATVEALAFCGPWVRDQAVIIFDDWGWMEDQGRRGQKEAFEEFLATDPSLTAKPLDARYIPQSRVFLLERA
jgi:predicted O-methyltransferase YrrM